MENSRRRFNPKSLLNLNQPTHRMTKTRIYNIWSRIRNRCQNPNYFQYEYYGGRGISVCNKWQTFKGFYEDMKEGYADNLSIDRINNNTGYYKENCRWATVKEQAANRRSSHLLTFNGRTQILQAWAKELNINHSSLLERLDRGWSIEKTLTTKKLK